MARYIVKPRTPPYPASHWPHDHACARTFRSPADPIPPCGSPDVKAVSTYFHNRPPGLLQALLRIGGEILGIAGRALENPATTRQAFQKVPLSS